MSKQNFIQRKIVNLQYRRLTQIVHTELNTAVSEILRRREDKDLVNEVESFLDNDIPDHFRGNNHIFYLSRYVATPDYETLLYIDQVAKYGYPIIIGEDSSDILTSHTTLKRNLVKLPIVIGESKNGHTIIEHKRIADLNTEQGKKMKDVKLLNGGSLIDFHHNLAKTFFPKQVKIIDESSWVDRHSRGELVALYENILALLVVHGIMLEYYDIYEADFLLETVIPAMKKTKARFGYTPLIAPLDLTCSKKIEDYNSYPESIKKLIPE